MRVVYLLWFVPAGCVAIAAGCVSTPPEVPTYSSRGSHSTAYTPALPPRATPAPTRARDPIRPVAASELIPVPPPADLDALLGLARSRHPGLAAAAARVDEARGRMIQAGLYPNPTVGHSGNQINDGPGTAGQQGGFVGQEFVTAGKLRIAREAGRFGVSAADWHAASKWFDTAARVKVSYVEHATALAVLRETERMADQFAAALGRTEKLATGGRVDTYDVSRLKVEVTQIANRVGAARQRVTAAERMLAVAVGVDRLPGSVKAGELTEFAPLPAFNEAAELAGRSSFVLAAAAEVEQARVDVRQAEVKPIPNVQVMAMGMYDFAMPGPMANVQVGLPIPLWDRNQGNILAAQARLAAATAGVEQTRLKLVERLTHAYQRYENARRQLELYRSKVLPDAAAALAQIDKVYEAKGERFFDTLDARRVLAQSRIDYAQALGDLWAAVAEIESLIQQGR
jgi:cobalt-zinc-cadmium efflux system outer membrane protein